MILSAQSIRDRATGEHYQDNGWRDTTKMIAPFSERTVFEGMSYGLSGAGYDVRIDQNVTLHPRDTVLASIMEHLDMPHDLLAKVADKSTWARQFLTVQNTIIEPGWRGFLTVELINHSPLTIEIKRGTPIAQLIFMKLDQPTEQPYTGKYQDQKRGPQRDKREIPANEPVLDASWYDEPDNVGSSEAFMRADSTPHEYEPMIPEVYYSSKDDPKNVRQAIRHNIRQENDEYACSCGKRWDISEGEQHP